MPTLLPSSQVDVVASVSDPCDGCGAAAKLVVTLVKGGELAFCGHHANRMVGGIVGVAARISLEEGFEWAGRPPATLAGSTSPPLL